MSEFPRNQKEFNMFVTAAKSAEDYIKMSSLLDRAEELKLGVKTHVSKIINLNMAKVISDESGYHVCYTLDDELLTCFDELYQMIRNLKITVLDHPEKITVQIHQGMMLMPMAHFVEIGVGTEVIKVKPGSIDALKLSSVLEESPKSIFNLINHEPSEIISQEYPVITVNNEMWHNFMHNETSIIEYLILEGKKLMFPCKIKIEFDYIDPYIDGVIDMRCHMLDQMIVKTKDRWFNSIDGEWTQSYDLTQVHRDKADKHFSRAFLW
jgi:hypothetical protein